MQNNISATVKAAQVATTTLAVAINGAAEQLEAIDQTPVVRALARLQQAVLTVQAALGEHRQCALDILGDASELFAGFTSEVTAPARVQIPVQIPVEPVALPAPAPQEASQQPEEPQAAPVPEPVSEPVSEPVAAPEPVQSLAEETVVAVAANHASPAREEEISQVLQEAEAQEDAGVRGRQPSRRNRKGSKKGA